MGTIESSNTIVGAYGVRRVKGLPVNSNSESQLLTIGGAPTGGTFKLSFQGFVTTPITWSTTNAVLVENIKSALWALQSIGNGNIFVYASNLTAGTGGVAFSFTGGLAGAPYENIGVAVNSLTGSSPTLVITKYLSGSSGTYRGASPGSVLLSTDYGLMFFNEGQTLAPQWTQFTGESPNPGE